MSEIRKFICDVCGAEIVEPRDYMEIPVDKKGCLKLMFIKTNSGCGDVCDICLSKLLTLFVHELQVERATVTVPTKAENNWGKL